LLFSTLHTNDAAGAITRLLDMGVESFLLSSTLLGVLAQRLVRVICPYCKEPARPDGKLLNSMGIGHDEASEIEFFAGKGCEECRYTGFRGRTAIFEYLPVDDDIRKEITKGSSNERIKEMAMGKGLMTLRQDGWRKVRKGVTTISEVLKVTLEK
jgi:general secretion pathway protein E